MFLGVCFAYFSARNSQIHSLGILSRIKKFFLFLERRVSRYSIDLSVYALASRL